MSALPLAVAHEGCPFDLDDDGAYRRWRAWKLAHRPATVDELVVDVADPCALDPTERDALLWGIARAGVALYRSPVVRQDRRLPVRLGAQLGLHRLDANWLADEDGISSIAVSDRNDGRGGFIPYTDRPIRWHTDGYYHPEGRSIRGMILHCVRPAASGGANALLDPELAYLALRDASPAHVRALMQPDAMTIPAREDDTGVARAAQTGPVFSVDARADVAPPLGSTPSGGGPGAARPWGNSMGRLHLRYTARTRSIAWKADDATRAAVAALETLLQTTPWVYRVRLEAGMGLVGHNVLHDRAAFVDDPARPRLLYRARFLDRVATPWDEAWRGCRPPAARFTPALRADSADGTAEPQPWRPLEASTPVELPPTSAAH